MADPVSQTSAQIAAMPGSPGQPGAPAPVPVVVKKYANRRLYNTETSSYITLDNLADMIRAGRDFVVYDAKSAEDITRGVLTQIIVEEESKGSSMLPTNFLRQLIGFYGGNLQGVVPRYLEQAMATFARQQQHVRQMMQQTLSPFLPVGVEEMSRQNMAMMERAMSMFNPFHRDTAAAQSTSAIEQKSDAEQTPAPDHGELQRLRDEVENLKKQLVAVRAEALSPTLPASIAPEPPTDEFREGEGANVRMTPPVAASVRKDRPARSKSN